MSTKKLKDAELLKLELYQESLRSLDLEKNGIEKDVTNTQLAISNHNLIIQNLRAQISTLKSTIEKIENRVSNLKEDRNSFVEGLCEKYSIDTEGFGYDTETGEIIENPQQDEIEDASRNN